MLKLNKKTIISAAIIPIVLGILGNALWETLIKPTSGWFFKTLLYLSLAGTNKYKNSMYSEVAKGFHEQSALEVFGFMTLFLISLLLIIGLAYFLISAKKEGNENHPMVKFYNFQKKIMDSKIFIISYVILAITFFSLSLVREQYINKTVTYFYQLIKIDTPYLTQAELSDFNSKFAQIKNKEGYTKIIDQLRSIAQKHGVTTPDPGLIF